MSETTWALERTEYMRLRLELAATMMRCPPLPDRMIDDRMGMSTWALGLADELLKQSGARIAEK